MKSLERDITGPQRRRLKIFKKLQLVENEKLNINDISDYDWVTHYTKLWNGEKTPENLEVSHYEHSGNNLLDEIITVEELNLALIRTKNSKSPGMDNLNMALFKYGGYPIQETLLALFNGIWKMHHIPEDWETGLVINIKKKRSKTKCKNNRGITFLPTT